jgi:hypothetical protein
MRYSGKHEARNQPLTGKVGYREVVVRANILRRNGRLTIPEFIWVVVTGQ